MTAAARWTMARHRRLANAAAIWSALRPAVAVAASMATGLMALHPQPPRELAMATASEPRPPATPSGEARAAARLERSAAPDGGERLRGEADLLLDGGERARVLEEVELDRAGRLARAEVRVARHAADGSERGATRMWLDASAGAAVFSRDGIDLSRTVTTVQPWAYMPLSTAEGAPVSTPVAAYVARRAAAAGPTVHLFGAAGGEMMLVSDQVAATDGDQGWVVLADDLATFSIRDGRTRLVSLRIAALDVEILARR